VRDHARLAGPGPRDDEDGALGLKDSVALDGVQPREDVFGLSLHEGFSIASVRTPNAPDPTSVGSGATTPITN
jgi:hypothetical protein